MKKFVSFEVRDEIPLIIEMMSEDRIFNRSEFIRRLIHQEWARRYSRPNPLVSVEDAVKTVKEKFEDAGED